MSLSSPPLFSLWMDTLSCFGMLYCIRYRNLEEGLRLFRLTQISNHHSRRQKPHGPILTIFGTAHLIIIQNSVPPFQVTFILCWVTSAGDTHTHTHIRTPSFIIHTWYNLNKVVIKIKLWLPAYNMVRVEGLPCVKQLDVNRSKLTVSTETSDVTFLM